MSAFSNPWVWVGVCAMLALQMAFTYVPVFNGVFQTAPIGAREWSWIIAVTLTCAAAIEAEKWLHRCTRPSE
ncbi:MAG: cation transporting ATPase C-terminal domain-containing protein [Betaproteobacteria bacterium]|nr:cation transporting ATPase C-terminal domain-containing protein [Betaproteobacteria bacterium]